MNRTTGIIVAILIMIFVFGMFAANESGKRNATENPYTMVDSARFIVDANNSRYTGFEFSPPNTPNVTCVAIYNVGLSCYGN